MWNPAFFMEQGHARDHPMDDKKTIALVLAKVP